MENNQRVFDAYTNAKEMVVDAAGAVKDKIQGAAVFVQENREPAVQYICDTASKATEATKHYAREINDNIIAPGIAKSSEIATHISNNAPAYAASGASFFRENTVEILASLSIATVGFILYFMLRLLKKNENK
ncbi:uncharacterized protein NEMAJ01_1050 [Nematocida major]|uniref:uncharacterized protein n=1 Tax=Nematocida major TaxID=1912982 RepID=UPI0020089574|nr:uncharacterized protein NEMAJ01_1050 [Nematocida major]KAH9386154.1 hypothetical protein NEMAJ01_1050 [Nematocida major]